MTPHEALPPDQVPRLQAYKAAHPDVTITAPAGPTATWTAARAGKVIAHGLDLKALLDRLGRLDEGRQ
jgi:hypothetical protein